MKTQKRNIKTIYFRDKLGEESIVDDEGYLTGETKSTYGKVKKFKGNVSPATRKSSYGTFGAYHGYSYIALSDEVDLEIDEEAILYVDVNPDTHTHTHVVKMVSRSLNVLALALEEVKVNA